MENIKYISDEKTKASLFLCPVRFASQDKVKNSVRLIGLFILLFFIFCPKMLYAETINIEKLADAIYYAEGGAKTRHPYGILAKYKHTTPRQACLNTINSAHKRFQMQTKETDFIHFLSLTYCPIGASNDPSGLNIHWERNVKSLYTRR